MRRTVMIVLATMLAACGDDDGPGLAGMEELRVVKVSGDQSVQVPDGAPPAAMAPAMVRVAVVGEDGYTDEPLVARVEAPGGGQSSISGPSYDRVPVGTLVHWELSDEAGQLLDAISVTDDSARVVNQWAPSTKAGVYKAYAQRVLPDGRIVTDAEWTLEVLSGEPVRIVTYRPKHVPELTAPDATIDGKELIAAGFDAYANLIGATRITTLPDSLVRWRWSDRNGERRTATQSGWTVVVPDYIERGYSMHCVPHRDGGQTCRYPLALELWMVGTEVGDPVLFSGTADF